MKETSHKNMCISSKDIHSHLKMLSMIHKVSGIKYIKRRNNEKVISVGSCVKRSNFK